MVLYAKITVMWTSKFTIKIYQEEDNSLYAEVIELPGCFTTAENIEELHWKVEEAVQCYLEWMQKDIKEKAVSFDYRKQYA